MATARAVRLAASNAGSTASLNTEDESSNRSSMYLSDGESYISDGDTGWVGGKVRGGGGEEVVGFTILYVFRVYPGLVTDITQV